MSFSTLGLDSSLLDNLQRLGYNGPTPVQREAIPAVLAGGDLIVSSQTGSGKTAAFVLPILQKLGQAGGRAHVDGGRRRRGDRLDLGQRVAQLLLDRGQRDRVHHR